MIQFHGPDVPKTSTIIRQFLDLGPGPWMYPKTSTLNMIQFQGPQLHIKLRQACDSLSRKARLLEDQALKLMRNNKQQISRYKV